MNTHRMPAKKQKRNDPCACGSGKKYKICCGVPDTVQSAGKTPAANGVPLPDEVREVVTLANAGRYESVERRATELLRTYPNYGPLWKLLGLSLWLLGKPALHALEMAAELLPSDAEALTNFGNALRAHGILERSVAMHRRALAANPGYAEAHNNLGSALQDLARVEEAMACFRQAIAYKPDFALAHSNLGNLLTLQNRPSEGEESCRRALRINSRFPAPMVQLAEIEAGRGNFSEAEALLRQAIAVDPSMPEAWAALVRWRKMTSDDGEWLAAAERIAARQLPPRREIHLRYAMGKYFDDLREFDRAFANYRRANELTQLLGAEYNRADMAGDVDRIIRTCNRAWLEQLSVGATTSERPVFLVGMWRSGTTLGEQILASHPQCFGAGELPYWNSAAAALRPLERSSGPLSEFIRKSAAEYLEKLSMLSPDVPRVVDKMCVNFMHLGLIHAAFPRARIIHMQRSPVDTCLSIYFQNFQGLHPFANDLDDLAHYYGEYLRVTAHWKTVLPAESILNVPYEGLVADPDTWTQSMLQFVGLPWDDRCRSFDRAEREVSTFSKWQVRQPISRSSVERWRHYQQFLGPLSNFLEGSLAAEERR